MTTEEKEVTAVPEVAVMFRGREIFAKMPSPEQLLVWQRTIDRLTKAPVDAKWTGREVMAAMERLRLIVDSLLNPSDIDWIDDQFLAGTLEFRTLAPLIELITDAFAKLAEETETADKPVEKTSAKKRTASKKVATS